MSTPILLLNPAHLAACLPQDPGTAADRPTGGAPAGGSAPGTATTQQPAPTGQGAPPCADSSTLLTMGVFLAVMYFVVMRPEQKRRKEQQAMLASIKAGDTVVTIGGMHGVVLSLTDKTVTLRVDAVKMTFDRSAVARVERGDAAAAATPPAKA